MFDMDIRKFLGRRPRDGTKNTPVGTQRMPPTRSLSSSSARRLPQQWRAGLFACCDDAPLCCTVTFCQCNAAGQVYQRATGGGCLMVAAIMWTLFVITQALSNSSNILAQLLSERDDDGLEAAYVIVGGLAGALGFVTTVTGTYFLCVSRRKIRERDRIPPGDCGALDDCCVSYWCGFCALMQMLRHEGVAGNEYRACTAEAV